ncbi:hypothetical protein Droror1_Dr00024916 [Drosera rotundifolia]
MRERPVARRQYNRTPTTTKIPFSSSFSSPRIHSLASNSSTMASRSTASTSQTAPLNPTTNAQPLAEHSPLLASYDHWMLTLLDTIDRLKNMRIVKEPIQLPKIVVVGAQSSGKSSVLDSLAGGIGLSGKEAICTSVPVFIRLERNHLGVDSQFSVVVKEGPIPIEEADVAEMIFLAGLGVQDLSLVVKKAGVPDLTMVDFPGIGKDGVDGYWLRKKIMEQISQEESIILCAVSANKDFLESEAFRMCRDVDPGMERSILVVTKVDMTPDDLLRVAIAGIADIADLTYVLVRNSIGDETYAQGTEKERTLFENCDMLSGIHESNKGIQSLAQKVVRIQGAIITKSIQNILQQIHETISINMPNLNRPPQNAMRRALGLTKASLRKIIIEKKSIRSPYENQMKNWFARSTCQCQDKLKSKCDEIGNEKNFLDQEIEMLNEADTKKSSLKFSRVDYAFIKILDKKLDDIFSLLVDFVSGYLYGVTYAVKYVLSMHTADPHLLFTAKQAAENMIARMKEQTVAHLREAVEIERAVHITLNDAYQRIWDGYSAEKRDFLQKLNDNSQPGWVNCDRIGLVKVGHLRANTDEAELVFYLRWRIMSHWSVVRGRLVDNVTVDMVSSVKKLVEWEMECEILNKVLTEVNAASSSVSGDLSG